MPHSVRIQLRKLLLFGPIALYVRKSSSVAKLSTRDAQLFHRRYGSPYGRSHFHAIAAALDRWQRP
jgi:hypothetical protein